MAAFYGIGIDNAIIELDSQEVPILDGSAMNFVKILKETGFKNSDVPIKLIKITNSVEIEEGEKFISIEKSNTSLEIDFEINYKNQLIKKKVLKKWVGNHLFLHKTVKEIKNHLLKVDGVMIGRAIYHSPYFLAEIEKEVFGNDNVPTRSKVMENLIPVHYTNLTLPTNKK